MSFLLPLAEVAGESAAAGAGEAAAGAEAAGAKTAATTEEAGSGRVQNFQQGRQQGQGASKVVTGGEVMGELNQRAQSGAE